MGHVARSVANYEPTTPGDHYSLRIADHASGINCRAVGARSQAAGLSLLGRPPRLRITLPPEICLDAGLLRPYALKETPTRSCRRGRSPAQSKTIDVLITRSLLTLELAHIAGRYWRVGWLLGFRSHRSRCSGLRRKSSTAPARTCAARAVEVAPKHSNDSFITRRLTGQSWTTSRFCVGSKPRLA
jgi:hypothetical protein